ncbi:MAG: chemotaxis protein CheA [Deltaproteobacteria bacterium]|nr:chemotaxis protein CheA [Deltaproteobacteria bacterium]
MNDIQHLTQVFLTECREHLVTMERIVMDAKDSELTATDIDALFRAAHSIKGGCGACDFKKLAEFLHVVESVLMLLREEKILFNASLVRHIFESIDVVSCALDLLEKDVRALPQTAAPLMVALAAYVEAPNLPTENIEAEAWMIELVPQWGLFQSSEAFEAGLDKLRNLGGLTIEVDTNRLAASVCFDPEVCYLSWTLTLMGRCYQSDIDTALASLVQTAQWTCSSLLEVWDTVEDEEDIPDKKTTDLGKGESSVFPAKKTVETYRVDLQKINILIELVGELIITQNRLRAEAITSDDIDKIAISNIVEAQERNLRQLQDEALRLRMVKVNQLFERLPRLMFDLEERLGKKAQLDVVGGDIEVDKKLIEKLADPLNHLIRNALDHGIESADDREKQGKPRNGLIELCASQRGNYFHLQLSDDGGGINLERIKQKAFEVGILDAQEMENATSQQLADLIFQPGFSTAGEVTDVSGRGVGMDVVRKNIESLGGNISLTNTSSSGTCFVIQTPLTLSILDGQLMSVGDETYVIPLLSIIRTLKRKDLDLVELPDGRIMAQVEQTAIEVLDLAALLGSPQTQTQTQDIAIIVEHQKGSVVFLINALLEQQQVVVKRLDEGFQRVSGASGATILGDGSIAMILDASRLVSKVETHRNTTVAA